MPLRQEQKVLIHEYQRAGQIPDLEYRAILVSSTGGRCRSAADKDFPQDGFEIAMARLEALVFNRVAEGVVRSPIGRSRYIRSERYWRNRLPGDARINTRQRYAIDELWRNLQAHLPESARTEAYIVGIVEKATGKPFAGWSTVSKHDAGLVIDALRDRLAWAIRGGHHEAA